MGPRRTEAIKFFDDPSKVIAIKSNELRSKPFLKERLSMVVQKGNADGVMGTFRACDVSYLKLCWSCVYAVEQIPIYLTYYYIACEDQQL